MKRSWKWVCVHANCVVDIKQVDIRRYFAIVRAR